jgi:hypothetical protein
VFLFCFERIAINRGCGHYQVVYRVVYRLAYRMVSYNILYRVVSCHQGCWC